METPYTRYLDDEYDEIAILREMQAHLLAGATDQAIKLAMKAEAVKYVKQSLKKVDYEVHTGRTKKNSGQA
jgi:hypothetical protein